MSGFHLLKDQFSGVHFDQQKKIDLRFDIMFFDTECMDLDLVVLDSDLDELEISMNDVHSQGFDSHGRPIYDLKHNINQKRRLGRRTRNVDVNLGVLTNNSTGNIAEEMLSVSKTENIAYKEMMMADEQCRVYGRISIPIYPVILSFSALKFPKEGYQKTESQETPPQSVAFCHTINKYEVGYPQMPRVRNDHFHHCSDSNLYYEYEATVIPSDVRGRAYSTKLVGIVSTSENARTLRITNTIWPVIAQRHVSRPSVASILELFSGICGIYVIILVFINVTQSISPSTPQSVL